MIRLELLRVTERETLKFRLIVLLVVSLTVFARVDQVPILAVVGLISTYLAYSAILRIFLLPRFSSYALLGLMMLADALTVVTAIYLIGVNTPVIILIPISVVYFGLYQGYVSALVMAVVVSFSFIGVVFATDRLEEMTNVIAIQIPSSFLLALLIGYLAQARFRESEERRAYQQVVQTETRGRRLLQIASVFGDRTWEGLSTASATRAAAEMAQLPWIALVHAEEEKGLEGQIALAGANYAYDEEASLPNEAIILLKDALQEIGETEGSDVLLPSQWLPPDSSPTYTWAYRVSETPFSVLCVMGPSEDSDMDESTKRSLRAFAPLLTRVVAIQQQLERAEHQSRELVGELKSAVESTERLNETRSRRVLQFSSLSIDPQRERVRLGPILVHLSRTEFDLLYTLAENAGGVYNAETLLRTIWGPDYIPQGKPVDVAIHRLRRKLDTFPGGARLIRTIRGRGYTFVSAEATRLSSDAPAARETT